jgi:integrase
MTSGSRQEASCPETGLHHWRLYDLLHTFASLMLTLGTPIAFVSEQMGHANIQLTVKLYGYLEQLLPCFRLTVVWILDFHPA